MVFRLDFGFCVLKMLWTISEEETMFKGRIPGLWIQAQLKFSLMSGTDLLESLVSFFVLRFLGYGWLWNHQGPPKRCKGANPQLFQTIRGPLFRFRACPRRTSVHFSCTGICLCHGFVSQWLLHWSARWGDRTGYNVSVSTNAHVFHFSFQFLSSEAVSKDLFKVVKLHFGSRLN